MSLHMRIHLDAKPLCECHSQGSDPFTGVKGIRRCDSSLRSVTESCIQTVKQPPITPGLSRLFQVFPLSKIIIIPQNLHLPLSAAPCVIPCCHLCADKDVSPVPADRCTITHGLLAGWERRSQLPSFPPSTSLFSFPSVVNTS